jgi:hypothetical protein
MPSPTRGNACLRRPFKDISMAQYSNVPPPDDSGGWSADAFYYPPDDPRQGGVRPGTFLARLTDPRLRGLGVPERAPPGQFLPFLLGGLAGMPRSAYPARFLAPIGLPPPPPMSMPADGRLPVSPAETLREERPVPPLPSASAPDRVAYAELTKPTPTMAPGSGEQIAGFGTTPPLLPSEFTPARTAPQPEWESAPAPALQGAGFATLASPTTTTPPEEGRRVPGFGSLTPPLPAELGPAEGAGDGLDWNVAAGFEQGAYDILGTPSDGLTAKINRSINEVDALFGTDFGEIEGLPLGSRWIARNAESSLGIPDPAYIHATTPGQRVARTVGEGGAYLAAMGLSPFTARLALLRLAQIDPQRARGFVNDLIALGGSGINWLLGEPDPPANNPAWQSLSSLNAAGGALAGGITGSDFPPQWLAGDGQAVSSGGMPLAGGLMAPDNRQGSARGADASQHFGGYGSKIVGGENTALAAAAGDPARLPGNGGQWDADALASAVRDIERHYRRGAGTKPLGAVANGVDLRLFYNPRWTAEQRADADIKVAILDKANTVVRKVARRSSATARAFKKKFGDIPAGKDIDHKTYLQVGGDDTIDNMHLLDYSVNRSIGAQIQHRIKRLPLGSIINRVTIEDR